MKMFVWRSEALANYGPGLIISLAENQEEAIEKAWVDIERHLLEYFDWADDEYLDAKREAFKKDFDQPPKILDVLLVKGSE